ncbi:hypothetical protein L0666_07610 [Octadecabacter sp. CECT 8868]|uniref:hypothetical protein n=1 Tax=Octadecabacter algicola TaxID=2909342 RepID=UPI001F3A63B4|nr:hypothetical protein [Octadecabacter algicola]MCF2904849.1 hypothetical protein [Octadecabacter algicola]
MAVRFSRFGTDALLDQFGEDLRDVLSAIEVKNRAVLISDENLSGRMPGRDGQPNYEAAPALMARAETVIREVFGTDADVVFQFTTRAPDAWLRSSYKHNLRTSRLVMDEAEYTATYRGAANLATVVQDVEQAVTGAVHVANLKDLTGGLGPAQPLIDLIGLPDHLGRRLTPHPAQNAGPNDGLVDDLLALNRSALSDEALKAAKMDLLGKAQEDDG